MQSTFDLKTLNLPNGSYAVSVKAKGMRLKDSNASNIITFIPPQLKVETSSNAKRGISYNITTNDFTTVSNKTGGLTYNIGGK